MNSPLNTYILRLADVYLTYAEACLGNNSTLSDGRGLYFFNRVRERAKINKSLPSRWMTLSANAVLSSVWNIQTGMIW